MSSSSKPTKRSKEAPSSNNAAAITDPRFASFQTDPRYRLPSKRTTHVKLDKRFSHMLRDPEFNLKAKVDRYGRPVKEKAEGQKGKLEKFYEVDEESGKEDRPEEEEDEAVAKESETDTTSSDGESDNSEVEEDADNFPDLEQGGAVPMGEDISRRIAVVNLDWDNIRAADLMAVFESFLPKGGGGKLVRVSVYPSEFGKERMEREEMEGPPKEIFKSKDAPISDEEEGDEDEEEEEEEEEDDEQIKQQIIQESTAEDFDSAKLRRYQLERLRYYYAILECSSPPTAKAIYDAVDGTEYLTTANFFDLRFVPDETDFTDDTPRDVCESIPEGYKPSEFVTGALQHSNVKLTWDADDAVRKEAQAKAFRGSRKEIDENDLKAYLGSDTSDDEEEEGPAVVQVVDTTTTTVNPSAQPPSKPLSKKDLDRQRTRQLLGLSLNPTKTQKTPSTKSSAPVGDLQITFSAGLSSSASKNPPPPGTSSVFENTNESTVQKYVRRERERKQKRKDRLKASRSGEEIDASTEAAVEEEDLGFDDPFFEGGEPATKNNTSNAVRKEERKKKKVEREEAEVAEKAQRAELELLMTDADPTVGNRARHFNIEEIEKAEKRKNKKGKKGKGKKIEVGKEVEGGDGFDVAEVQGDGRFAGLFAGDHEFAIDPNNPRFRKTKGMKALLEEGRRKRRRGDGSDGEASQERKGKKMKMKG